jgi:hypothetical protein
VCYCANDWVDEQLKSSYSLKVRSFGMLRRVALVRTDVSEKKYRLHHKCDKNEPATNKVSSNYQPNFLLSVLQLLVTANVVPSSPILVTLIKEALSSSETSVLTRAVRRHIP